MGGRLKAFSQVCIKSRFFFWFLFCQSPRAVGVWVGGLSDMLVRKFPPLAELLEKALPARPAPARGGRRANLFGQKPVLGRVCLSQSSGSCLFCRESRCFCSLRGGEEIRGWPRVFFELTLESVRRGLVVINMTERVRRLIGVWLRIGPRGQAPGASTSPGWGRLVENSRLLDFNFIIFFPRLHQGQGGRGEAATISSVSPPASSSFYLKTPNWAGP